MPNDEALRERFLDKVYTDPNSGCWVWTGANGNQYGVMRAWGKTVSARHISMMLFRDVPISAWGPNECVSSCEGKLCVNPDHLRIAMRGTGKRLKGNGVAAKNYRMAAFHCGHPKTPENSKIEKHGRRCRACANAWYRKHRSKKREKALLSLPSV